MVQINDEWIYKLESNMKLVEESDLYFDGVKHCTNAILQIIDTALEGKIGDSEIREEVSEEILFNIGALLDGSGAAIDEDGKEHVMAVCFVSEDCESLHYNDNEAGFHTLTKRFLNQ